MDKKDYQYTRDIPSPVALDYPYRNLSRIVGSIPSSLTVDETKDRIGDYYKDIVNKFSDKDLMELSYLKRLETEIARSYLSDITKGDLSDFNKLTDAISKDYGWSEEDKKRVKFFNKYPDSLYGGYGHTDAEPSDGQSPPKINVHIFPEEYTKDVASLLSSRGNPKASKNILFNLDIPETTAHEAAHANDLLKGKTNQEVININNRMKHRPDEKPEYAHENISPFELAEKSGTKYHHLPLEIYGEEEPVMLMRPFQKAGIKPNPTIWEKIKGLLKK